MNTENIVIYGGQRAGKTNALYAQIMAEVPVALSVRQPWAWLIVAGHKDIENRTWSTGFRGRVLIHAGKKYGPTEKEDARIVERDMGIHIPETLRLGGIVGAVEIVDCVTQSDSPWFRNDGYGFVLRHAVELPFRPLVGRLGFFNVRGDRSFMAKEVA
ncbi:MAG: ASCH domain-containing protein [Chthoniobacteraceae bacterium]